MKIIIFFVGSITICMSFALCYLWATTCNRLFLMDYSYASHSHVFLEFIHLLSQMVDCTRTLELDPRCVSKFSIYWVSDFDRTRVSKLDHPYMRAHKMCMLTNTCAIFVSNYNGTWGHVWTLMYL